MLSAILSTVFLEQRLDRDVNCSWFLIVSYFQQFDQFRISLLLSVHFLMKAEKVNQNRVKEWGVENIHKKNEGLGMAIMSVVELFPLLYDMMEPCLICLSYLEKVESKGTGEKRKDWNSIHKFKYFHQASPPPLSPVSLGHVRGWRTGHLGMSSHGCS